MEYKHTPKTKTALIAAIREEIHLQGECANLNCIDTSAITNMRELFSKFKSFNGDISGWDVSNVTDMSDMFYGSSFRGDISGWNVEKVEYFLFMFKWCRISQEHRPARFRMNRDANSPDLNGKVRFWDDTVASFSLTGDGVLTVSGDLSCNLPSGYYSGLDDIPVRKLIIAEGVTTIGERMFSEWGHLEVVTFPESLTEIKDRAFERCFNIARLNFPKRGLLKIGGSAFSSCPVRELHLPETLTYIGSYTFDGFKELEELVIPDSVESVGKWSVFRDCTSLKSVKLSAHLKTITESMFSGCTALENVQMPENLEIIERYAFHDCPNLKPIDIPDSVKTIFDDAFETEEYEEGGFKYCIPAIISNHYTCSASVSAWEGPLTVPSAVWYKGKEYIVTEVDFDSCEKMTEVRIPDTISELPCAAFYGCVRLKKVFLPDTIKEIPFETFEGCWRLREVHLGSQIEVIGTRAFKGCEFLQHLYLPSSLKRIENGAFADCVNLVDVATDASLVDVECNAFSNTPIMDQKGPIYIGRTLCGYGGKVPEHACLEIKDGSTSVAEDALRGCVKLELVIFPETLKSIGNSAFEYTALKEVLVPWKSPIQIGSRSFPKGTCIRVPAGSADAYKNAEYWQDYKITENAGEYDPYAFLTDDTVFIGRKQPQRLILVEKPQRKDSLCLYGIVVGAIEQVDARELVKDLLFESFRNTAAFLDWEEDCDFGSGAPLGNLLEYDKHRYAIVDIPVEVLPKTVIINEKEYLIDEELYKSMVSKAIDWLKLGE